MDHVQGVLLKGGVGGGGVQAKLQTFTVSCDTFTLRSCS